MAGTDEGTATAPPGARPGLATAVLDQVEAGHDERATEEVVFADDLLPGVGDEPLTLSEGLAVGGRFTFVVLLALVALEELEGAALGVLAPDIRDTFGMSDGAIVFLSAAAGSFIVLGALPMGLLADRMRRAPIIGWANVAFSVFVLCSGLAVNAFSLFWARFGVGVAKANTLPVHGSLLADTYPIGVRGRIASTMTATARVVGALSPVLVGAIATLAGGPEGWRWAFFVLGLPAAVVAVVAFRLPEPPRGQFEMADVLGEVIEDRPAAPVSVEAAFARLMQIRTLRTVIIAFAAMGFGLFTGPVLANLYVEERFDLDAFGRGLIGGIGGVLLLVVLPFAGRHYDGLYRRDPSRALTLIGLLILPAAVLTPVQYVMPNVALFAVAGLPQLLLLSTAFALVGPVLQSIVPYRLRGLGSALGAIYIFFVGATGGALLAALFTNLYGVRAAVLLLIVPSTVVGGVLILRSATFIRNDLSMVVAELREELDEHERRRADPDQVPVLQVAGIDFSYGHVQVLFDAGFEVRRGEVLALLGTNGAGKSTLLRVVAGLGTPARGVVRLGGQTVTFVSPEARSRLGIHLLQGGKGVFPAMAVAENLEVGAFAYRTDTADRDARIGRVLSLFPDLADRLDQPAGSLSGGQQQMLALAIVLLHDPEVLLIDELSLGLAPVVVQELLTVVERLKAEGLTIVIVEQSLNVALSVADRAVFMEKGEVRFEGPAAELAERDDLVRAVFLGREGG